MEYASGGELYDYCNDKQGLYDDEARKFFRQIISAVHYLHTVSIWLVIPVVVGSRIERASDVTCYQVCGCPCLFDFVSQCHVCVWTLGEGVSVIYLTCIYHYAWVCRFSCIRVCMHKYKCKCMGILIICAWKYMSVYVPHKRKCRFVLVCVVFSYGFMCQLLRCCVILMLYFPVRAYILFQHYVYSIINITVSCTFERLV